jgi:hypothetical protein
MFLSIWLFRIRPVFKWFLDSTFNMLLVHFDVSTLFFADVVLILAYP